MKRTRREATVERFHHESDDLFSMHLADFKAARNFARPLMTFGDLTPYEFVFGLWTFEAAKFNDCRDDEVGRYVAEGIR